MNCSADTLKAGMTHEQAPSALYILSSPNSALSQAPTWPREAAATGLGVSSLNMAVGDCPSSEVRVRIASTSENGGISSCSFSSSSVYDGGSRSGLEDTACPRKYCCERLLSLPGCRSARYVKICTRAGAEHHPCYEHTGVMVLTGAFKSLCCVHRRTWPIFTKAGPSCIRMSRSCSACTQSCQRNSTGVPTDPACSEGGLAPACCSAEKDPFPLPGTCAQARTPVLRLQMSNILSNRISHSVCEAELDPAVGPYISQEASL